MEKNVIAEQGGTQSTSWIAFLKPFLLLLVALAFHWAYHIEESIQLPQLFTLFTGGWLIQQFLPAKLKLVWLNVLFVASAFILFPPIEATEVLVISAFLVGISLLPLKPRLKMGIMGLIALAILLFYSGLLIQVPSTLKGAIPVIGAIFMFRMSLFLYEQQFEKSKPGFWHRLSYFFMLPNLVMVIFPIVDYKTWSREYKVKPEPKLFGKGIRWILLGSLHLFMYRILYYYALPAPNALESPVELFQFLAVGYLLTIRLMGLFHIAVGMLCMFGFNLPPAFRNHFLADGFNDLWRRINVYWKDYVMKMIYFPVYFRVKKWNPILSITLTMLIVFFFNWLLHAYQWFWVKGMYALTLPDVLFWGIFGVLVAVNSVIQSKKQQTRKGKRALTTKDHFLRALRVMGVFLVLSLLWSLWTSPTVGTWFEMIVAPFRDADWSSIMWLILLLILSIATLFVFFAFEKRINGSLQFQNGLVMSIAALFVLMASLSLPGSISRIETISGLDLDPVLHTRLNAFDAEKQFEGYYENLIEGNNLNSPLWSIKQKKPDSWIKLKDTGIKIPQRDLIKAQYVKDTSIIYKDKVFTTNAFGLRDRAYPMKKGVNTVRIALLGGSIELGSGVGDNETFENQLEDLIKSKYPDSEIEIWNFAMDGAHLWQHLGLTYKKILQYDPDCVIYAAHNQEGPRAKRLLIKYMETNHDLIFDYLDSLRNDYRDLVARDSSRFYKPDLPSDQELLDFGYGMIADKCLKEGEMLIHAYIPSYQGREKPAEREACISIAEAHGFISIDLSGIFNDYAQEGIEIAPYDRHPNARGHRIIAEQLLLEFEKNEEIAQKLGLRP